MSKRRVIEPDEPEYPAGVRALVGPRPLHVDGALPQGRSIAIVGTRHPTDGGRGFAFDLAKDLALAGLRVWSGGAVGIDAAAHRGALAAGAPTVAVLGSGLDHPSPPSNADLFREIVASGGAIVSPFEDHATPMTPRFLQRNGVLVAAVELVVVVECGFPSGALNAAKWARRLGKILAVVPGAPWAEKGRGCAAALVEGAKPVASPAHVLALLGMRAKAKQAHRPEQLPLLPTTDDPLQRRILDTLASPVAAAALCEILGEAPGAIAQALLELELAGLVEEHPPGVVTRRA